MLDSIFKKDPWHLSIKMLIINNANHKTLFKDSSAHLTSPIFFSGIPSLDQEHISTPEDIWRNYQIKRNLHMRKIELRTRTSYIWTIFFILVHAAEFYLASDPFSSGHLPKTYCQRTMELQRLLVLPAVILLCVWELIT